MKFLVLIALAWNQIRAWAYRTALGFNLIDLLLLVVASAVTVVVLLAVS